MAEMEEKSSPIEAAVSKLAEQGILEWLEEDVLILLDHVHRNVFPYDTVVEVEHQITTPIKGIIDLILRDKDSGRIKIRDWKYTGKLDDRWELRERRSLQFPLYAGMIQTVYGEIPMVEVYGLSIKEDDKTGKRKLSTNVLPLDIDQTDILRAWEDATRLHMVLNELSNFPVWLRNPSGCRCYGDMYKCQFEDICWLQRNNSKFVLDNPIVPSYTSISEFNRCNERLRLLKCQGKEEDPGPNLAIGSAFHESVAAMYRTKEEGNGK